MSDTHEVLLRLRDELRARSRRYKLPTMDADSYNTDLIEWLDVRSAIDEEIGKLLIECFNIFTCHVPGPGFSI